MRTRVLPTLLAVLILTNPVCCQMLGSVADARPEEPTEACARCACEREAPCGEREPREPSNGGENVPHAPCECPNCDLCQCVCAGAIVKEFVTLEDTDGETPINAIAETPVDLMPLLLCAASTCDSPAACGDANVGRAARIRHSSLLC